MQNVELLKNSLPLAAYGANNEMSPSIAELDLKRNIIRKKSAQEITSNGYMKYLSIYD